MKKQTIKILCAVISLFTSCVFLLSACNSSNQASNPTHSSRDKINTSVDGAHEHKYGEWVTVADATCTEKGEQERTCTCGEKQTQSIDALGHVEVIDEEVASTCTVAGTSQGKHCSVCDLVIVKQTELPLAAHVYDNDKDEKCNICGYKREASVKKVIVNFGDSIFGNYQAPNDISTKLAELTGATVYNCGFGGCRMSRHHSSYYAPFSMFRLADAIVSRDFSSQEAALEAAKNDPNQKGALVTIFPTTLERLKSIDFSKVDIITIAYGTNDWQGGIPLDNQNNKTDTDYIAGALRYSIEKLQKAYPNLKIYICSPIYRCWNNEDGSLNYDSDDESSAVNGVLLTDIVDIQKCVAAEYNIPFIDNYHGCGINRENRLEYFLIKDGTHPILQGRYLIAENIAKHLDLENK